MTKRLALAFGTRDRVELSERSIRPLIHDDIQLWIVDGSQTDKGERWAASHKHEENHVRINVRGGADAYIAYALSTLLNETDAPYVGLCENDVLLHRDWLHPVLGLFDRGRSEGLEVGAVSARCYADRILCQRDGYALMHNLGAGHIVLTRHAARLVLDDFRTSWATENRKVFAQVAGIDLARYWCFRGNQQFVTADWGFERVLAAHGLAALALTPSPVEMIGQDPPLADQGLTIVQEPVELLRDDAVFARFVETTRRIRDGDFAINGQRFCRLDDGSQIIFPHQIGALGGDYSNGWGIRWAQGFGPFSYVAGGSVDEFMTDQVNVPLVGPCSFFVSGGDKGGKVEIVDTHSGYTCAPELLPEGPDKQMMQLVVPGAVAYRNVRLTALTPGVVFYGVKVSEPQPFVPHWSFDHAQLAPAMLIPITRACEMFPDLYAGRTIQLGRLDWRFGHMTNLDQVALLALLASDTPHPIVEFGTFTGRTTYNMALNTVQPIVTIDCGPNGDEKFGDYIPGEVFLGTPEAARIELIVADSKVVDLRHLYGQAGLVIIDGGHDYDTVVADTRLAWQLVRPGGLIVWDDYSFVWPGVQQAVDAVSATHELRHIHFENLVVMRMAE